MKRISRIDRTRVFASALLGIGGLGVSLGFGPAGAFAASPACGGVGTTNSSGNCQISGFYQTGASTGAELVNTYYPGKSIDTSANTITVGAVDSRNGSAAPALAAGDTILILENQGATVNTTATIPLNQNLNAITTTYGSITGTPIAGKYQVLTVSSYDPITGEIIPAGRLDSTFSTSTSGAAANFQVIRVPNISGDATLVSNLTALSWNAAKGDGGIFAMIVSGQLAMNGKAIDVSGEGFSGGIGFSLSGDSTSPATYPQLNLSTPGADNANGQKGEGIYGTPNLSPTYVGASGNTMNSGHFTRYTDGYGVGDFGFGALGNAGGGGTDPDLKANDENTGGGGGGNGGAGGNGGYSWATGFDLGGRGGYPVVGSATQPSLVLGGGGGAGTINNSEPYVATDVSKNAGSGGQGGGIIYLQLGGLAGSGEIVANGANGVSSPNNDGAGGGGAGGTIYLQTSTLCDNPGDLTVAATGGNGGNTWSTQNLFPAAAGSSASGEPNVNGNAHGPGGGGGGGELFTNLGTLGSNLQGGLPGTTTTGTVRQVLPSARRHAMVTPLGVSLPTPIPRFSGPTVTPTSTQLNYGATAGANGYTISLSAGPRPASSTSDCTVPTPPAPPVVPVVGQSAPPTTVPVTTTTVAPTTTTTTMPVIVAKASQPAVVTVPATHTGEPWSGSYWWYLVGAAGLGGAALIYPRRRRGAHNS